MSKQKHIRKNNPAWLLIFVLLSLLNCNVYAQQPTLTWLGTLGGNTSYALNVSDDGLVVVGESENGNHSFNAFRWTAADGMQDLGTLGGDASAAYGISSDGAVIVGKAYDINSIFRAFRWTVTDGMQDMGVGDWSQASGVSSNGSVIAINKDGIAYLWTLSGGLENLGNLGGDPTWVMSISNDGSVAVGYSDNDAGDPYAFRWVDGTGIQQIGTFYSFAKGVSGDGNTATGSETGMAGLHRAFRWTESGGFEFNIAGNFTQGNALSGDGSIIVGDADGAFRLSNAAGLENLNQVYSDLLTSGSELYTVIDISTDGQFLVGYGLNGTTGQDEGYLLALNTISSVDESPFISGSFVLYQNSPNPFNSSTEIKFALSKKVNVAIKVYDILGNEVATLVNEVKSAGKHSVSFDASQLTSGVYFCKILAGSFIQTRKMTLLRTNF